MTVKTGQPLQGGGAPEYAYHDRTAWRCAVFVGKSYGSKGYPQRNAAHVRWTLLVTSSSPLKQHLLGGTLSWQWRGGMSGVRVVQTETTILWHSFPGASETVGQVFKFVWRLQWKINAVCMSLSPLVSSKSRFVTYLLNFPRTWNLKGLLKIHFCVCVNFDVELPRYHSSDIHQYFVSLLWDTPVILVVIVGCPEYRLMGCPLLSSPKF